MDRIVRYAFCTAGIVLTVGWLGSVATGYLPSSQRAGDASAFNAAASESVSVARKGRTVRVDRPPFPSMKDVLDVELKRYAKDRLASQLERDMPAVIW